MTEEELALFIQRERMMGRNFVRKYAARTAASLGLATYEQWLADRQFEDDLSAFRVRWIMASTPIMAPYAFPIVGIAGV